jgi:cell division protein FtsQ
MDGQRRIAEPLRRNRYFRPDCAPRFRIAARSFAVLFLGLVLVRGILVGGHLDYPGSPWLKMPGQIAGLFGLAAIDIELAGLQHHEPGEVLAQIGVKPGGPILGFDAKRARALLEELDWVDSATVVRRFPNQLQILVVEREPFVIWQNHGALQVVDQKGKPMGGTPVNDGNLLLHVVGEGANIAASQLVNQMEVTPSLKQDVKAAVRVGDRRWDLHMNSGLVIALPEVGLEGQLKAIEAAYLAANASALPASYMDFRVAGEVSYRPHASIEIDPTTTSSIQ